MEVTVRNETISKNSVLPVDFACSVVCLVLNLARVEAAKRKQTNRISEIPNKKIIVNNHQARNHTSMQDTILITFDASNQTRCCVRVPLQSRQKRVLQGVRSHSPRSKTVSTLQRIKKRRQLGSTGRPKDICGAPHLSTQDWIARMDRSEFDVNAVNDFNYAAYVGEGFISNQYGSLIPSDL